MAEQSFSLIPFPDSNIPEIKISGRIRRQNNLLTMQYSLSGKIENIIFPEESLSASRKDELWLTTCFEFFMAVPNQPEYWEFNMSPSGDWNIYRMDEYRRVGFREEISIQQLTFSVKKEADCVLMEGAVDLSPIFQAENAIQVGITAVIQTKDGQESYWALTHPNPQADFHLRESFILGLAK